ncbi:MAG: PLP-dependent aminotransferase family protein [Candidatus Izimaplasma sp.]|nr:PLP-dependent aminotransferase family protein [Candidatus Izimaplasma bacterium]
MITFYFDKSKDIPLYEQLYTYLKKSIEKNELHPQEKLPSKRKLAQHLKISQTTVETAYMQLLAEGYIKSVPRVGYFVLDNLNFPKKRKNKIKQKIIAKSKNKFKFDFKTNMVDAKNFPYQKFAKIKREIILDKLERNINEIDFFGLFSLREKIADILFAYRGIEAIPEQIVVGSGSEHLISLLVILLGRDNSFLTEDPAYIKNYLLYKEYGAKVSACGLDEKGISMDGLKKSQANIVHITPSHQFPSGIITPVSRRIELLNWANEENNRFIIEDDYDSEFRFSGNPIPALKVLDEYDKVIYMNSFSKSLSPSFRVSFMVLPRKLVKRYRESFSYFSCSVPITTQLSLERFIANNEFEKHLNRMKNIYKTKRDVLIEELEKAFGSNIEILGYDAGLHFLVRFKTDFSENLLIELAKIKLVRVYGLNEFFINKNRYKDEPVLVFGYSHLELDELKEAVKLLKFAWSEINR